MTYRICLVCMGNICRSPMAEVVLRDTLAEHGLTEVEVDSAGTGGWHAGDPMDSRALETLAGAGLDGSSHRARQFTRDWFGRYDLVLAMDDDNLRALRKLSGGRGEVALFRSFDPAAPEGAEVPDPYYGGQDGFDEVLRQVRAAAEGLAKHLANR
ncbi:low molecular weight phosphotyrosine protein phosphatase [Nonomuraea sp. NBC_01738]|uniref:low molecular weight protein-tyrosine-phosphatase n=1 Tax=Nonomuraea sp. NBC_01738 TaxID=2976003 RepID=UPI002E0F6741|nr:low molecular weight phosphotyrosine protein phosphatase [Nonomuraea sp. NBC_01738]